MEDKPYVESGTLHYSGWLKTGRMLDNRDYLDPDSPDHTYNYLVSYGIIPEDFGIEHPYKLEFQDRSRNSLIDEVLNLRRELHAMHSSGFF